MSKQYNVLMIIVDEERFPAHFPKEFSTPARDWLARRGLSFTNYHVNTCPCTPSRSVIFTGLHTPQNGMVDNTSFGYVGNMDPAIPTLGDMAAAGGYYCAYKGKWHLADINPSTDPENPTEDAMQPYGFNDFQHTGDLEAIAREGHTHDGMIAAEAVHWLHNWKNYDNRSATQPFFLVCSFVNPHDVMTVDIDADGKAQQQPEGAKIEVKPPPEHALYTKDNNALLPPSWSSDYNEQYYENKPSAHREFDRLFSGTFGNMPQDEALWRRLINYYMNCQRDVDRHIMTVLEHLEDTGLVDDTIIIFTADHGELAGAHGMRTKGPFVYEETNHVPLIICHPEGRRGETTPVLAAALDMAPTLQGLCQLSAEQRSPFANLVGHDLSAEVFGSQGKGPRSNVLYTYTSFSTFDADFALDDKPIDPTKRGFLLGIRTDRYKFARYFGPTTEALMPETAEQLRANFDLELYDLQADADEVTNLANDPGNDDLLLTLNFQLNQLIVAELGQTPFPKEVPEDTSLLRGQLT